MEIWKPIPCYGGAYEASNFGNIRSVPRVKRGKRGCEYQTSGKLLKQIDIRNRGYLHVNPSVNGKSCLAKVHRLVAMAFIQSNISGLTINHKNGNKRDNRLENLEVVTIAENIRHACDTGLRNDKGEANRKAKLADSDIIEIRRLTAEGIRSADIAKKFNVGILAIQRIRSGLRWSHVK